MRSIDGSRFAPSRRRRRIAILVAILLLIGLPLYLWPLRGGIQGLPGASALGGAPRDPRSATAVAQLPADVWDGLMGHGGAPAGRPKPPGNLTRIAPHEDGDGNRSLDGSGITVPGLGAASTPTMTTMLMDVGAGAGGGTPADQSGIDSASSGSGTGSPPIGDGSGGQVGNPVSGGSSPFPGSPGPFSGGGGPGSGGFAPPTFITDPNPSEPPMATPEPSTLMLAGANLTLLGAVVWRCLRKGKECKLSG